MSFRIENKYLINNENHSDLFKFLNKNSATVLYPKREISSIYFDNSELESYFDSIEGSLPRKKIRIRCYPNNNIENVQNNLEIKINSIEGRYKEVKKDFDEKQYIIHGYFDSQYGLCRPIIKVVYIREYFKIFDFRATLDKSIYFQKYNSKNFKLKSESIILEIKSDNINKINEIEELIPFQKIRYSKFCNGLEKLDLV